MNTQRGPLLVSLLLTVGALLACGDDASTTAEEPRWLSPSTGSSSGYFQVTVDMAQAGLEGETVDEVWVGPNRALHLSQDANTLSFVVQGSPTPGLAELRFLSDGETLLTDAETFSYDAPLDPRFSRVTVLGASFSMGISDALVPHDGALYSPSVQVARQMGAYMPVPLLKEGTFQLLQPEQVGDAPLCLGPEFADAVIGSFTAALGAGVFTDADGKSSYAQVRLDPDLEVHNVAVGGSRVGHLVNVPAPSDVSRHFMGHIVFDPHGAFGSSLTETQLDKVEALEPTLIISMDTYGNDAAGPITNGPDPLSEGLTPWEQFEPEITTFVSRVAATKAEAFLANMPRPSLLPLARETRVRSLLRVEEETIAAGGDVEVALAEEAARIDDVYTEMDNLTEQYNMLLETLVAEHNNVHLLDFATFAEQMIEARELQIGDKVASTDRYGGLFSLDQLHFTRTGYAVLANFILGEINAALGTEIPEVNVEAIFSNDTRSPEALRNAGVNVDACDP